MSTPCRCDKCPATMEARAPGEAWTPDGYCHTCDRFCFPSFGVVGGAAGRLAGKPADRARVHNTASPVVAPNAQATEPYLPRAVFDFGVSLIPSDSVRLGVQTGAQIMDAVAPYLSGRPGSARELFEKVRRAIPRPRRRR